MVEGSPSMLSVKFRQFLLECIYNIFSYEEQMGRSVLIWGTLQCLLVTFYRESSVQHLMPMHNQTWK